MSQLSFEYDASENCSIAHYKGLTIRAENDSDAGNPWKEWEGNAPLIVNYGRDGLREYDKGAGFDLLTPFASDGISDAILRRHLKAICKAFEPFDIYQSFIGNKIATFSDWLANESKERLASYGGSMTDHKRELLADALEGMTKTDRLEALASIYEAIGWPALCTTSRGYSQGDYAELLLVATPAFAKAMGCIGKKYGATFWKRDLERAAELYGAWAWGDVYGYVIASDDHDDLASCWGYYGTDFDESGLADAAKSAADHILRHASDKRAAKLKELISNRVPLALRPALLADAATLEAN